MRMLRRRSVVLAVAVFTVFLLAASAAAGKFQFPIAERLVALVLTPFETALAKAGYQVRSSMRFICDIAAVYRDNQWIKAENEQLKKENQRMTHKLNELALEFLNYDMVTMGKATEISEMCYYDFLKYRKDNGNPMELQL